MIAICSPNQLEWLDCPIAAGFEGKVDLEARRGKGVQNWVPALDRVPDNIEK